MEIANYLELIKRQDLSSEEAKDLLSLLVNGDTTEEQIGLVLTALADKGESVEEIAGFAQGMRDRMLDIKAPAGAIDIVGTGGDGSNSINISTISAIVTAAGGVKVAKHGNRSASSKCGSADVLEALGVNINLTPEKAEKVLERTGLVFLFAPAFHPAMKVVGPVRKQLKRRTIFNYLGPFLNPGRVRRMVFGVANLELGKRFLEIAKKLNFEHLIIVSSEDGLDEISIASRTKAFELKDGRVFEFVIDPLELGFDKYLREDLIGGDAELNAEIARNILSGKETGAKKEVIVLNSAYGLIVGGKALDVHEGIKMARGVIDSGKALKVLEKLIEETNK